MALELIKARRIKLTFYCFGAANAWGNDRNLPPEHVYWHDRKWHHVMDDPGRGSSSLAPVLQRFSNGQVCPIDCTLLDHIGVKDDPHIGIAQHNIDKVVGQQNGAKLKKLFASFFHWLKDCSPQVLASDQGLAIVPWCAAGKDRSVAFAAILLWCLTEDLLD